MAYFLNHYSNFKYPLQEGANPGFRLPQLGAIHSAAAHFSSRTDPGIITMPTGSGKTAVLIASAFVLRAQRVLIITPSRLVREQIAEEAASLDTLRRAGAITADVPGPRVFSTKKKISSAEDWEALRTYDVVVGTVPSISPEYTDIPEPPADLFDLVLVDEAHHSPARTWQTVLNHFSSAKRLLFTATPFRQDQREIKGRFLFTYDLRKAYEDGVFGEIRYQPVIPQDNDNADVAIARAAENQFRADRELGHQHRLMVRTDSRKRATDLLQIYNANTGLRLRVVTGDKSLRYVKKVIEDLGSGELDGIICVNMLGEGFNFPMLKIAAIHSPHRSLNVTLQFIGRFARTTVENVGPATFLAIPSEIEIEAERLYDTRAVWQDIVQNLSAARVHQEAQTREVLESFEISEMGVPDLADLSLYALEPYYHVKVYQLDDLVDLSAEIRFPEELQIAYQSLSEAHNAAVYITRETSLPRWTTDDRLSLIEHDLFIFYQDPETRLLFICASRRAAGLYQQLSESFAAANPRPLPLVRLNRALNDIATPEFFNVGMRNRVASNTTESYRIVTGSNADKTINKSDGRLYHRGHVFGRGVDEGEFVTIGLSSASKIWSNKSSKLPELIDWCAKLASRIASDRQPITSTGLDFLSVGEEITELPTNIVGLDWPTHVYQNPPMARFNDGGGEREVDLRDFDLTVNTAASDENAIAVILRHESGVMYKATFSFETDRFFEPASEQEPNILVLQEREEVSLIRFLNEHMPHFYTADLALIDGYTILRPPPDDAAVFDDRLIEIVDWNSANADIRREFGEGREGRRSVHEVLERRLQDEDNAVVYYDHGTGEISDFVVVASLEEKLLVQFYHCKGAGGDAAGHRLADVYEIVGQCVKSVRWALKQRVLATIRRRFNARIGSHRFIKGNLDLLTRLLGEATPAQIEFEFIAVQPGLLKNNLPVEQSNLLAAANDHLIRGGFKPLRVLGSGA